MARITRLRVQGYRSIGAAVDLRFPVNAPLVLFGQNNCGKSNITKALELVLGGPWPGNHEPDDHEFFKRNTANPIAISVFADANDPIGGRYVELRWRHSHGAETYFKGFFRMARRAGFAAMTGNRASVSY